MIIADSMLGKLSRYLRMIGYDVEYIESDRDDSYVIERSEGNLVITRDKALHSRIEGSILLRSYEPTDQLKEISGRLPAVEHGFMELCSICGSKLRKVEGGIDLPEYVNKQADTIFYCDRCDKFYWNGSHTVNFKRMLEEVGFEVH